jgi:hypothetical protein
MLGRRVAAKTLLCQASFAVDMAFAPLRGQRRFLRQSNAVPRLPYPDESNSAIGIEGSNCPLMVESRASNRNPTVAIPIRSGESIPGVHNRMRTGDAPYYLVG